MKKFTRRFLALMIIPVILLLSACGDDIVRSNDLCAETSRYQMAETDTGYYLVMWESLYYADKGDLSNWVLVCNEPECEHMGANCPADVFYLPYFNLKDGKLQTLRSSAVFTEATSGNMALYTMNTDGTALSMEREIPGTDSQGAARTLSGWMNKEHVYLVQCLLDKNGNWVNSVICSGEDGTNTLFSSTTSSEIVGDNSLVPFLRGDNVFCLDVIAYPESDGQHFYRLTPDGYEDVSAVAEYTYSGAYLKDNILLHYVQNEGYFETDITDGTSQKRYSHQLEDAMAYHMTEDVLVEMNFHWRNTPETPQMKVYDGKKWHSVALPDSVRELSGCNWFPLSLTSQHLFFYVDNQAAFTTELYFVDLTAEEYVLTPCAVFGG